MKSITLLFIFLGWICDGYAQVAKMSDPAKSQIPINVTVLEEHKDAKGNNVRTIQYFIGKKRVTETLIVPSIKYGVSVPLNPDTLKKDSVFIVIEKSKYIVEVFYRQRLIRTYKAVFGPHPADNKCREGDRCTPEGTFHIISKNPKSHYDKFLLIDYPNDTSLVRFNHLKTIGKIPQNAKPGGNIGIHGTWKGGDEMVDKGIGWTDGCIALKNKDIDDLFLIAGVGTSVTIKK